MDDSMITCDEVIKSYDEEIKTIPKNFNEKKAINKTQNFYILLAFLLITFSLLIAVSIYGYVIKHNIKQNIYYHFTVQRIKAILFC